MVEVGLDLVVGHCVGQVDVALTSVYGSPHDGTLFLVLQLSLSFFSGELEVSLEGFVGDAEKGDYFRGPEQLVRGDFVAEALQVLDEADHLL